MILLPTVGRIREPHWRYGTTHRMIHMIVLLQLATASRFQRGSV